MEGNKGLTCARLRCEYCDRPIGVDVPSPRFSWELRSDVRGDYQTAYRLIVVDSIGREMWDSGKVAASHTFHVPYEGEPLQSDSLYQWSVRVWDFAGEEGEEASSSFHMGLLDDKDWEAQWIGTDESISAPLFRKGFHLGDRPIRSATAFIAGLGYYELYLNGTKVGDHVLDPNWTDFDQRSIEGLLYPFDDGTTKTVHYAAYDVTSHLSAGEQAVGVMLGNGFYNQTERTIEGNMRYGAPRMRFQIQIRYKDGTSERIVSDDSWHCSEGPITFNNVFFGEVYDARLEQEGWSRTGFDQRTWRKAGLVRPPAGRLKAQLSPPDKVCGEIIPVSRNIPDEGVYIFDLGRNISGWARLRVQGEAGTAVKMRFAEELDAGGRLDFESAGGLDQIQSDTYILCGKGMEIYEPRFTWHGFRYIEVQGFPGIPELEDLTGVVVNAAVEETGRFECSDDTINRIHDLYRASQLANLHGGVPSDCPHRERLGYSGDGQVTAEAAMFQFDMSAFYTKWIYDLRDAQNKRTGFVPHTAPFNGGGGGPGWGSAYVIMPLLMYRFYGDTRILEEHYEGMKLWVDYLGTRTEEGSLIVVKEEPGSWCLGDWCVPGSLELPEPLVNTFYYARTAKLLAEAAFVLGRPEEGSRYLQLYRDICTDFHSAFWMEAEGCYSIGRQGTDIFALAIGGLPENRLNQVVRHVKEHYSARNNGRIDTGIFGTALMFDVLSEYGAEEDAVALLTRTDFPSYGYMLENGATTLWEQWDGMHSHNHPMFGSVTAWIYKAIAGLAPHPEAVAFDRIIVSPTASSKIQSAKAKLQTIRGEYSIEWERGTRSFALNLTVPPGCTAQIHFPVSSGKSMTVTESGQPVSGMNSNVLEVASGTYRFVVY